jgi:hypothetical protein
MSLVDARPAPDERHHQGEFPLAWGTLDRLIGQIYESALDPSQWNATIEEIRLALCPQDWRSAFLMLERRDPPSARFRGCLTIYASRLVM